MVSLTSSDVIDFLLDWCVFSIISFIICLLGCFFLYSVSSRLTCRATVVTSSCGASLRGPFLVGRWGIRVMLHGSSTVLHLLLNAFDYVSLKYEMHKYLYQCMHSDVDNLHRILQLVTWGMGISQWSDVQSADTLPVWGSISLHKWPVLVGTCWKRKWIRQLSAVEKWKTPAAFSLLIFFDGGPTAISSFTGRISSLLTITWY